MNDKIDTIVAGVNRKDEKMWGDFYDRFYTALCVYVSKILPVPDPEPLAPEQNTVNLQT